MRTPTNAPLDHAGHADHVAPDAPATATGHRWLRPVFTVPVAVMLVFIVTGAAQLTSEWTPVGDWAVAELVVRHLGRHLPLSGPYSAQRGYNHPLPLVYALQGLPYRLFGERSSAGLAGTVWWNGAWLAVLVWLLARRAMVWLGIGVLLAVAALASTTGTGVLLTPWNPNLAVVPGVVMLFAGWRVALGEGRLLPLVAGLGVWCTGAHLGFAPLSLTVGLFAVGGLVVGTVRRAGRRAAVRRLLPSCLWAIAVVVVLTAPMMIDIAANGRRSNPANIVTGARPVAAVKVPVTQAGKVVLAELALPPAWATVEAPYDFLTVTPPPRPPLLLLAGVFVGIAALRRRAFDELAGLALGLLALAVAGIGLLTVNDNNLQPWYIYPAHAASIAFTAWLLLSAGRSTLAFARSQWPDATSRLPASDSPVSRLAPPAAALLGALLILPSLQIPDHELVVAAPVPALVDSIRSQIPPGRPLIVDGPTDFDGYYSQALVLELDRAGFDVRVPDDEVYLFTPAMAVTPGEEEPRVLLSIHLSKGLPPPPQPTARLLAQTPVPPLFLDQTDTLSVWQHPGPDAPP